MNHYNRTDLCIKDMVISAQYSKSNSKSKLHPVLYMHPCVYERECKTEHIHLHLRGRL